MSQATGLEALTRAYQAPSDPSYLAVAHQALPVFTAGAAGRRDASARRGASASCSTRSRRRRLDHQRVPADADRPLRLRARERRRHGADGCSRPATPRRRPRSRTSTPAPGRCTSPARGGTLDYHELVTGFLQQLCARTKAPVYCTTAQHFESYLKTPPALTLLTGRVTQGKAGHAPLPALEGLSRRDRVLRGTQTVFETSAPFAYGTVALLDPGARTPAATPSVSPRPTWPATSAGSSARCRLRDDRSSARCGAAPRP